MLPESFFFLILDAALKSSQMRVIELCQNLEKAHTTSEATEAQAILVKPLARLNEETLAAVLKLAHFCASEGIDGSDSPLFDALAFKDRYHEIAGHRPTSSLQV